jgi:hypothetical protein
VAFRYIINQNGFYLYDDSLLFGEEIYESHAKVISENYFRNDKNSIQLWIQMAETNKNLGKISSASKCVEECDLILSKQKKIVATPDDPFYQKLAKIFQTCFLSQIKPSLFKRRYEHF